MSLKLYESRARHTPFARQSEPEAIFTAPALQNAQNAALGNKRILIGEPWIGNSTRDFCIERDTGIQAENERSSHGPRSHQTIPAGFSPGQAKPPVLSYYTETPPVLSTRSEPELILTALTEGSNRISSPR